MARDLSERENAESAVAELAALLDLAQDAILVRDVDGRIVFWNRGAERTYGWRREEALGKVGHDLLDTTFPVPVSEIERIITRAGRWEGELTHRTRDGRRITVESRWAQQQDASGAPTGFLEVNRDISDRRASQEALRASEAALAERSRLLEIANSELQRSNRDLAEFAFVAAHDLKSPITTIGGFATLLRDGAGGDLNEDGKRYASHLVDGVQKMQTLVDDLLYYSRLATVQTPEPIDTSRLVSDVLSLLAGDIDATGVDISIGPLPMVSGDSAQLVQLFQNLITNALKFKHPDHPPTIHVWAEPVDDRWCFAVEDNGIGIDNRHRDRIFQMFQRLHTQTQYPGTGVGLAICRRVVENHGGRIWFNSSPGGGSTFYFTLSAAEAPDTQQRPGEGGETAGDTGVGEAASP
jgi:PAS domain S-box-containing protein